METAENVKLNSFFNPSEIKTDFSGPSVLLVNGFLKLFTAVIGPNFDF